VPAEYREEPVRAKGTFRISQNHTLTAPVRDPTTRTARSSRRRTASLSSSRTASTWQGTLDQGSVDSFGRYEGVFRNTLLLASWEASTAIRISTRRAPHAAIHQPTFATPSDVLFFNAYDNQNFKRTWSM